MKTKEELAAKQIKKQIVRIEAIEGMNHFVKQSVIAKLTRCEQDLLIAAEEKKRK